jgi:hypothetical protein
MPDERFSSLRIAEAGGVARVTRRRSPRRNYSPACRTATLPQPTAAAITRGAAIVAWAGAAGRAGRAGRLTGANTRAPARGAATCG